MKCFFYKPLILLFLFSVSLTAQKDSLRTYRLNEVVISATRTEIPLLLSPTSITVIDSAEITNSAKTTVFDLLKNIPGVSFTQQGGPGKMANVYMRGGNSGHTLLLIDGLEMNMVNDPSNVYDFSYLSADNINRIEVLRGPQSTLYGSDAVSGVINIITRKGEGKPTYNISAEGGSYGTYKGALGLNGGLDQFNYSLTFSRYSTDGFTSAAKKYGNSEKDGTWFNNLSSRIGADFSDNFSLSLFTRMSKGKSDYDQYGGYGGDDPTYVFDFDETSNRLQADVSLYNGAWQQTIGISSVRNIRKYSFSYTDVSNSHYDGTRYKFDWQNNIKLIPLNLLTFGFEAERELASSEYYSTFYNSIFGEHFATNAAVFLQDQFNLNDEFVVTAGVRYDKHNKFGDVTTYKIAPIYIVKQTGTKFRFSIGNSFKAPSIFNLHDPVYGNASLKPEKNKAWDIGVEQYFLNEKYSAGVTYFKNSFTDLFGFNPLTFQSININKAETSGAEVFANADFSDMLQIKLNYTYTKAEEISGSTRTKLLRRPLDKLGFTINVRPLKNLNTFLEVIYVGSREDIDYNMDIYNFRVTLDPYVLVNLSATYSLLSGLELFGRIDNLLNYKYEEIKGFQTAELSGYAGFRIKF